MENILEIRNLYFSKGKEILKGVNLSLRKGEVHSIIGVNGTGKTTLSSILMGLNGYLEYKGEIKFNGSDIKGLSITERARKGITMAWQIPAAFEGLTVKEYLELNNQGMPPEKALNMVGLKPEDYLNRKVNETLSGGERKRIELASILCMHPLLVILDEPDSGIDMASMNAIKRAISKLKEIKTTVVIITHNEKIALLSDRASLMCDGKIVKTALPGEVTNYFKMHCKRCEHKNEIEEGAFDD